MGMPNEQIRTLYNDLHTIKLIFGDLVQRIDQLEHVLATALGDQPTAIVRPTLTTDVEAITPVDGAYAAPLVFIHTGDSSDSEELYPNGIDGMYGQPLLRINTAAVTALAKDEGVDFSLKELHRKKVASYDPRQGEQPLDVAMQAKKDFNTKDKVLGTVADVDQNKINEAHWAVVVHSQEDIAVLKALWPLIEHRMRQMGFSKLDFDFQSSDTSCEAWLGRHTDGGKKTLKANWGEVPPVLVVRPSERVDAWLTRYDVMQAPVDPARGVPFYLMLIGRPGPLSSTDQVFISLSFQYELDVFWGVGRLVFSNANGQHRLDDYRTYAERVVAWETRPDAASHLRKEIAFFGTRHEDDKSTMRSADELITPLATWGKNSKIVIEKQITQSVYLGSNATRNNLERLLSATTPPALLFTASHGIGLPLSDPSRLVMHQGALVTADFEFGSIKREHWLAGEDLDALSSANLDGMIAFLFGCYSVGCPQQDEFIFDSNRQRPIIAPFPFIAQLPQRMLAKGALAVIGHVERAWTYSFSNSGATSQIQPFQDVLGRLLRGMPAGSATDQFNVIQGARSLTLTKELEEMAYGATANPLLLSRLWMARNDARNYLLLGDPAVKLTI
ncbi:MAG: hypothetical protein HGA19_09110 [Oscillochloris sp.]|nr:hypothetical protein [Oscillochloris sp.]